MKLLIHWFNRMPIRLILSMVSVSLMSISIMFISTNFVVQKQLVRIEPEIRNGLMEGLTDDPNFVTNTLLTAPSPAIGPPLTLSETLRAYTSPQNPQARPPDGVPRKMHHIPENLQYREELLQTIGFSALTSMLFGAILALLLAKRIANPLVAVSKAATEIAEGNLGARAHLGTSDLASQDEASTLARNFNEMAATLERLERERRNMIADIAHELRTPLTILQSRLDAFEDGIVPLNLDEISKLSIQTQLLTRLVEDLRILSLADAGRLSIRKQPLALRPLIEDVLSNFGERFHHKDISARLTAETDVSIRADPDRLAQVLVNLLENALRHTPHGGWIQIDLKQKGTEAQIVLTDSGSGILPENLDKIFNRFFRESLARNRETGGTGLGLSIVKTLLELQGGTVTARNALGAGAQFLISLPLVSAKT